MLGLLPQQAAGVRDFVGHFSAGIQESGVAVEKALLVSGFASDTALRITREP